MNTDKKILKLIDDIKEKQKMNYTKLQKKNNWIYFINISKKTKFINRHNKNRVYKVQKRTLWQAIVAHICLYVNWKYFNS